MKIKHDNSIKNKSVLITGGTGSFGTAMTDKLINSKVKKIIIYSRDEMKQWFLKERFKKYFNKIEYIIGDVRDREKVENVTRNIDYIIHAAATKIVPTAERNPDECIKTNILGAMNIINSAEQNKVKKVIALSTDKASSPINLYGATKLCSDKLFTAKSFNKSKTFFSVVRYGNVLGSRGSIIPFFLSIKENILPITHLDMTRFFLSLDEAVNFVLFCFEKMKGGEIFVKKLPSVLITELAKIIKPKAKLKIIGLREGEKIHEQMIGVDDSPYTLEYKSHFEILPDLNLKKTIENQKNCKSVKKDFFYSSKNTEKINLIFLKKEIEKIKKKLSEES
ncbi:SDR family NAD(P)-dependent oxidoreductase [Candidatus Pelagibacter sp.]|nr:SDR family NAD(P)-dependent oxidoreductase [Candidatus Pelagibacter sp.]